MPEDRKHRLQALAARRKADAQSAPRKKTKAPSPPPSKRRGKGAARKPKITPFHAKKQLKQLKPKKTKRVAEYDSEYSEEEEEEEDDDDSSESELESDSEDDSEDEIVKKPSKGSGKGSKRKAPIKPEAKGKLYKGTRSNRKGKENEKGKVVIKRTRSSMKKGDDSIDEGVYDEEKVRNLSGDPQDGVNRSNILPARTRRVTQSVRYDFGDLSGDEDENDSDA